MAKETDISDLGPIDIVQKSWKIFCDNAKALLSIQLSIGLPGVITSVAFEVMVFMYQLKYFPRPDPDVSMPMIAASKGVHGSYMDSIRMYFSGCDGCPIVLFHLVTTAIAIGLQTVQGLSVTANIVAVGFVFDNKCVSFCEVIKTAIPRLWKLLVATLLCWQVLLQATTYAFIGVSILISYCGTTIPAMFLTMVFLSATFYLSLIYMVASGVSVLEEKSGWEALKKARSLLKEKWLVALGVQLLYCVPGGITTWLGWCIHKQLQKDSEEWCLQLYFMVFAQVVVGTFIGQLNSISAAVAYVSFKSYHGITILGNHFFGSATEAGYQRIEGKAGY